MRKSYGYFLICLFLFACGSGSKNGTETKTDAKTELNNLYNSIKEDKDGTYKNYFTKIDNAVKTSKTILFKPVSTGESAGKTSLSFGDGGNVTEILPILETVYKKGSKPMIFNGQIDIIQFRNATNNPVDSFCTYFNPEGRLKELMRLSENIRNMSKSSEYCMILNSIKNTPPISMGATFVPGTFNGRLIIIQLKDGKVIANLEVNARNSDSVSSQKFDKLDEAAVADFLKNIDAAILSSLNTVFKINGKPSTLTFYKL